MYLSTYLGQGAVKVPFVSLRCLLFICLFCIVGCVVALLIAFYIARYTSLCFVLFCLFSTFPAERLIIGLVSCFLPVTALRMVVAFRGRSSVLVVSCCFMSK